MRCEIEPHNKFHFAVRRGLFFFALGSRFFLFSGFFGCGGVFPVKFQLQFVAWAKRLLPNIQLVSCFLGGFFIRAEIEGEECIEHKASLRGDKQQVKETVTPTRAEKQVPPEVSFARCVPQEIGV